jgi:hypothetical protein
MSCHGNHLVAGGNNGVAGGNDAAGDGVAGGNDTVGDGSGDPVDDTIRRAIGGNAGAVAWVAATADTTDVAVVIVMAALLDHRASRLDRARNVAMTSRDRQVVEIARAHLDGRAALVDALARDHLVDHPDSLIVAWIAAGADARQEDGC